MAPCGVGIQGAADGNTRCGVGIQGAADGNTRRGVAVFAIGRVGLVIILWAAYYVLCCKIFGVANGENRWNLLSLHYCCILGGIAALIFTNY
ncbi:MAG: hypothetical protein ACI4A8_07160 [Muribaculaceae bacterium]